MGLASFLHNDWEPDADEALTGAIGAVVASEVRDLDTEIARAIVSAYVDIWVATKMNEDAAVAMHETFRDAERAYRETFIKAYDRVVRSYFGNPEYTCASDDGIAWWPASMSERRNWPKAVVRRIADAVAQVEAEHAIAVHNHFAREEARR